jgi:tryptophan synthase beta subunit
MQKGPTAHAAPLCAGSVGVLHGNRTYLMEDENGQIIEGHSISAGLFGKHMESIKRFFVSNCYILCTTRVF